ncbi:MAG: hypothetical protein P8X89_04825 [Reinekea sp.]
MTWSMDIQARRRQQKQLRLLLKARAQCYQIGVSAQRAAHMDNQLSALLNGYLHHSVEPAEREENTPDISSAEAVFIAVSQAILSNNPNRLSAIVMQLADQWESLKPALHEALASAIIRHQSSALEQLQAQGNCYESLYRPAITGWLQYLSVFLEPAVRKRIIPDDINWLDPIIDTAQPLTLKQALDLTRNNAELFNQERVSPAWALIFCDPADPAVQQHLLDIEQPEPEVAYPVYGAWGLPWCLERIATGLESVRTNEQAYRQWLLLTDHPLPQTPILQPMSASASKPQPDVQTMADSASAQHYLSQLKQESVSTQHQHIAQKLHLARSLLANNGAQQELYALALMRGDNATACISTRHSYAQHLHNLSGLIQLSTTPWWAANNANQ